MSARRPSSVEEVFARARSRFVPRLLAVFVLYVGAVFSPDIVAAISEGLAAPSEGFPAIATMPFSPSPSPRSPSPVPPATLTRSGDTWVLEQAESNSPLEIRTQPDTTYSWARAAQSFRLPYPGHAVRDVSIHVRYVRGAGMRASLIEIQHGASPDTGSTLWLGEIPSRGVRPHSFVEVRLDPPVHIRTDRSYALVLAPLDDEARFALGQLSGGDPYREGRLWVEETLTWQPAPGDLALRVTFVRASS
ncbi:MAG: hypothetical protein WD770_10305 [Actinomycetota bacterium]